MEFAQSLVDVLGEKGGIIVYSNFEEQTVRRLAKLFPHLTAALNSLIERMVDIEFIIKKNFYPPDFHGKTSIKTVLPSLIPEMSYDDFPISDGESAMAYFAYLAQDKYDDEQAETVRRNLLDYCCHDTLAMVKLHARLVEFT